MKKLVFFCILLVIVGCIAVSCKKDGLIDPQKFTITAIVKNGVGGEITPSSVEVVKGADVPVKFYPAPGYKRPVSILINGSTVTLSSDNYVVSGVANNYTIEAAFEITPLGILMQKPWKLAKDETRWVGEAMWNNDPLRREETLIFNADSKYQLNSKGVLIGDGVYSLSSDNSNLTMGGSDYKIVVLSQDTLEVVYRIRFIANGVYDPTKDIEQQDTYTH